MIDVSDLCGEIADMINDLETIGEDVEAAELRVMEDAARKVHERQVQLLSGISPRMAGKLSYKVIKNAARIKVFAGFYFPNKPDSMNAEEYRDWMLSFVLEFGKPGNSATTRRDRRPNGAGKDVLGRNIGATHAHAPIRRAWFELRDEVLNNISDGISDAIFEKWRK